MTTIRIACLVLAAATAVHAQQGDRTQTCARCHIGDFVEWSVSGHKPAQVDCVECHGPSEGHVLDERNHKKPDRIPRDGAVAGLCRTCHAGGCPRSGESANCQLCHHAHALVDTRKKPPEFGSSEKERAAAERQQRFRRAMDEGQAGLRAGEWKKALVHFEAALVAHPSDSEAVRGIAFCRRRLNPSIPGFRIVGTSFEPETGLPAEVEVEGLGIRMAPLPGGEFDLGSQQYPDSRPVHSVRLLPFYLGKYEVTQEQWLRVMGANPSHHRDAPDATRMPVENVSWLDCQEFVRRLNARVPGAGFRLPTEAEWEFASDGGTSAEQAWFRAASEPRTKLSSLAPRPVGLEPPNRYGLHDMPGNVQEWCSTLFRPYVYAARDGREDLAAPGLRVLRGGTYADGSDYLDPALRHSDRPGRRFRWNGLRLARDIPPERE